jgi:hypothetical protein
MTWHQPELLGLFQRIFDDIWQELEVNLSSHNQDEGRSELARRIVLAHRRGVPPDHIKAIVLQEIKAELMISRRHP